jgi:hypothetical protein
LTTIFQFTVPYLSYYSNFSYFSTEACINKHNPELECNGQCQLEKMVEQHDQLNTPETNNAIQNEKRSSSTVFYWEAIARFNVFPDRFIHAFIIHKEQAPNQLTASPPTPPPRLG